MIRSDFAVPSEFCAALGNLEYNEMEESYESVHSKDSV